MSALTVCSQTTKYGQSHRHRIVPQAAKSLRYTRDMSTFEQIGRAYGC
jgi:hypothetical protein